LFTGLDTFVTKGQTALYDACWLGTQKLAQAHYPRRLLILISDGNDNASKQKFNKTRDLLKEEGVPLYSIGIFDSVDYGTSLGMEGQGILDELSNLSGALALFPRLDSEKPKQVKEVFGLIANEVASQYALTIKREPFVGTNKWHKVSVRITDQVDPAGGRKRLTARTRQVFRG
jgi:Ca-activated chloride channel homolog